MHPAWQRVSKAAKASCLYPRPLFEFVLIGIEFGPPNVSLILRQCIIKTRKRKSEMTNPEFLLALAAGGEPKSEKEVAIVADDRLHILALATGAASGCETAICPSRISRSFLPNRKRIYPIGK